MSQSDSDFIEEESRQEYLRQQLLLHILLQLRMLIGSLLQYVVLPEECAMFANLFEQTAAGLRKRQEETKV